MFYVGPDGQSAIGIWDGGAWHAPASDDSAIAISTASSTVEARINKGDLGIVYPQKVSLTLASFRSSGRAPGNNATFDCPDKNNDVIDVMGGDAGVSASAWTRGSLSGNLVSRYSQSVLGAAGASTAWIGNQSHLPTDASGNRVITWSSIGGKSYQVLAGAAPGGPFVALSGMAASHGATPSFTDTTAGDAASRFYEVLVLP